MKGKDLHQEVIFEASPKAVYDALMDSDKHAEFTGSPAEISREKGGKISAWGGYIEGENLQLSENKKIVQKWRAVDWPEKIYSQVTFKLEKMDKGTKLIFDQEGVPLEYVKEIEQGWYDNYWLLMINYFAK